MLPWLVTNTKAIRVVVIGDLILDEYIEGSVTRISREAPVPILNVERTYHSAGGAANSARNVAAVGGKALLFGIRGSDHSGKILASLLEADNVDISEVVVDRARSTIKKTRVTSSNQQMIRVDWEKVQEVPAETHRHFLERLAVCDFDAILISDYAKGMLPADLLRSIFAEARRRSTPCIVDPKGKDFHKYLGCTLITPNLSEAKYALNLADDDRSSGVELGRQIQTSFGLESVLVTLGADGMTYIPESYEEPPIHKASQAQEVFDVSGAGDTVAAIMSLALGANASIDEALHVANLGAAIVVGKWGTQPVVQSELERGLESSHIQLNSKFQSLTKLKGIVAQLRQRQKKRIVFTNGCFDILHAGHVDYLQRARALGDCLLVAVNDDRSVSELKGLERPINSLERRVQVLSGLSCVDYLLAFSELTPELVIRDIKPDFLVKGGDYRTEEVVGGDFVNSYGGQVVTLPFVTGCSTSLLIEQIRHQVPSLQPSF